MKKKIIILCFIGLIILTCVSSTLAIRTYMITQAHPIAALTKLEYLGSNSKNGKCYYSDGWSDKETGNGFHTFCAKRTFLGIFWISAGG